MNTHQHDWLIAYDLAHNLRGTHTMVAFDSGDCLLRFSNGGHCYNAAIRDYNHTVKSKEHASQIISDYIHHFENLIQTK